MPDALSDHLAMDGQCSPGGLINGFDQGLFALLHQ